MKSTKEIKAIFTDMDELLIATEKELKEIMKISKKLKQFSKKIKILEDYYHSDWLEDREHLIAKKEDKFYATTEDAIWNLTVAYHQERIKIIKQLTKEL